MTRILFFGALRDAAGCAEMQCEIELANMAAVRAWLAEQNPALGDALNAPGVRVAVDRSFAAPDAKLNIPYEIAFMSPLSGG